MTGLEAANKLYDLGCGLDFYQFAKSFKTSQAMWEAIADPYYMLWIVSKCCSRETIKRALHLEPPDSNDERPSNWINNQLIDGITCYDIRNAIPNSPIETWRKKC